MSYQLEEIRESARELLDALEDLGTMAATVEVEGADPLGDAVIAIQAVARLSEVGED